MKLHDRTPDCGYGSTPDELDKLFNYDPLYRVLSATGRESTSQTSNILWGDVPATGSPNASLSRGYSQAFKYDKLGNMLELNHTATSNTYTRNYVYNNYSINNKLSQINNGGSPATVYSNFSYDVNGNMTGSDTDRHYTWDAADQLKAFSIQVGTSEPSIYAQYLYSGGQRIKKIVRTAGGDYEVTVYDGSFEYCKKVSGSTTYEKNYTHIEGAATVRTGNGTPFPGDITDDVVYNLGDNIGSINVRLSTTGTLIDREEYYPFGDTSLRTFTYKRYRYVNKEKDQESGLYYYGARYYAAWTCRFISVDPLAAQYADLTPYNYAANKPINKMDIDGMQAEGQTRTPQEGDTRVNENGQNEMYLNGSWGFSVEEVEVTATYSPYKVTITEVTEELSGWTKFWRWVGNGLGMFEKSLKGDTYFRIGIEFKTTDGESKPGNDPAKAKPENIVFTIENWDEIDNLVDLLGVAGKLDATPTEKLDLLQKQLKKIDWNTYQEQTKGLYKGKNNRKVAANDFKRLKATIESHNQKKLDAMQDRGLDAEDPEQPSGQGETDERMKQLYGERIVIRRIKDEYGIVSAEVPTSVNSVKLRNII